MSPRNLQSRIGVVERGGGQASSYDAAGSAAAAQAAAASYTDAALVTAENYTDSAVAASGGTTATYAPTITGFSAAPAGGIYTFTRRGSMCRVDIREANTGTGNATTHTFSLPPGIVAKTRAGMLWSGWALIVDPTAGTVQGRLSVPTAGTVITAFTSANAGSWAAGACAVLTGNIEFEV